MWRCLVPLALCLPSPSSCLVQPSQGGGPGTEPPAVPHSPSPLQFPCFWRNRVIQALQDPGAGSARMLWLLGLLISTWQRQQGAPPGAGTPGSPLGRPGARGQPLVPHHCRYVTQEGCASSSRLKERFASAAGLPASL